MTALAVHPHPVAHPEPEAPRVRVRRAPPLEPPFDDEIAPVALIPGTAMLPFAWPSRGPRPTRPTTRRQPRGPDGPTMASAGGHGPAAGPGPDDRPGTEGGTRRRSGGGTDSGGGHGGRPAPAAAAAERFLNVCIEVLNGHRPASHLRAVTAPAQINEVTDQLIRRTARTYLAPVGRAGTVPRRVRLQRLHTGEPRDGVAEVVAILGYGSSTWAMAVRLERQADTWLCTLIQVI